MFLNRDTTEEAGHLLGADRLGMGMRAGRPFWQDGIIHLQPNIVHRVFINCTIGDLRNGAADQEQYDVRREA
jgi:hypothetical protein